jgi:hypothetical protein
MDNWIKINEAAKELKVSQNFIRTITCRSEFKDLVNNIKPAKVNVNDKFKKLVKKFIQRATLDRSVYENKYFIENYLTQNKSIAVSQLTLKWTDDAIECYSIGCNCSKCEFKKQLSTKCRLKFVVLELVKKLGAPKIKRKDIL